MRASLNAAPRSLVRASNPGERTPEDWGYCDGGSAVDCMSEPGDYHELKDLARRARWLVMSTVANCGAGHIGGPLSAVELLIALYFRVMNSRPEEPAWPER